ncbi:MAG: single-stranded-DNA-specific exonuclease RecJ [Anaerolineaceae bacterium]
MTPASFKWLEPEYHPLPDEIAALYPEYPFVAEVLYRRGYTSLTKILPFLHEEVYSPASPFDFPQMAETVGCIRQAILEKFLIGIWGDFDVDGQTATALLVGVLRSLGAKVEYHVPVRAKESHGITIPYLDSFLSKGIQLLITCDTGITAHDAIAFAKQKGITVIITDHHTLADTLPDAQFIIHPHLLPEAHPARPLCGVGAAFELSAALLDDPTFSHQSADFLELVTLGTIADLAALTGDNRYFVQRGLKHIRTKPSALLQEIFSITNTDSRGIDEEDISFSIAPRLNAIGRLGDANPAVEMLLSNNADECRLFVSQIEAMNAKRKFTTDQVFQAAYAQVENNPELQKKSVLILSHPEWPGGIVGIVASRLVDVYHKPALVISSPDGEPARGSARSVEGVDITACLAENHDWLIGFGGHPMAAGFSLLPENLDSFRTAMEYTVDKMVLAAPLAENIQIDAIVTLPDITTEMIEQVDQLAPFGPGNPPLTFVCRNLTIAQKSPLGKNGEHAQFFIMDECGNRMRVIRWQAGSLEIPENTFDLAFSLRISEFKGVRAPQLEWIDARPIKETSKDSSICSIIEVLDFRANFDAGLQWINTPREENMLIWSEGLAQKILPGKGRNQLIPSDVLVIAGTPPDRKVLDQVIENVSPHKLVLFGLPSSEDEPKELIKTLLGMIQFSVNHKNGQIEMADFENATAQNLRCIQLGLELIQARGLYAFTKNASGQYLISSAIHEDMKAAGILQDQLFHALNEVHAFRMYYQRVEPGNLINGVIKLLDKDN